MKHTSLGAPPKFLSQDVWDAAQGSVFLKFTCEAGQLGWGSPLENYCPTGPQLKDMTSHKEAAEALRNNEKAEGSDHSPHTAKLKCSFHRQRTYTTSIYCLLETGIVLKPLHNYDI